MKMIFEPIESADCPKRKGIDWAMIGVIALMASVFGGLALFVRALILAGNLG